MAELPSLSGDLHLDEQWLAQHKGSQVSPEKMLLLAILRDGIYSACKPDHKGCIEAREWIERKDDGSEWIFSFENVCEVLQLDASAARREIMRKPGYAVKAKEERIDFSCKKGRPRKKAA